MRPTKPTQTIGDPSIRFEIEQLRKWIATKLDTLSGFITVPWIKFLRDGCWIRADETGILKFKDVKNPTEYALSELVNQVQVISSAGGAHARLHDMDNGLDHQGTLTDALHGSRGASLHSDAHTRLHALNGASDHSGEMFIRNEFVFFFNGDMVAGSDPLPLYIKIPSTATVELVALYVNTAPTAGSIIVDIHKIPAADVETDFTGVTLYTTQGNRPALPGSDRHIYATNPDVLSLYQDDVLRVYTDQVGTTLPGSDLTVSIRAKQQVVFS